MQPAEKTVDLIIPSKDDGMGLYEMRKKKRGMFIRILLSLLKLHLWFWGIIALFSLLYIFVNPPMTPLMLERHLVREYKWHKRYFIPLKRIPQRSIRMIITLEDANYYKHWGFDWKAVQTAMDKNRRSGRIKLGGSTISNQLARTIFLDTHRNYLRKYLEIQVTLIMECIMSKDRMLELYVNYIEWGKGIYGIDTASRHYYGCGIDSLGTDRTMKLVSILTNPVSYTPQTYYKSWSARQRYLRLQRVY